MYTPAEFLLAQYLRDPIRREPKNVGLFVIKDGRCAGKFLGEDTAAGERDLRTIRFAKEPRIYRKWVEYWREELEAGADGLLARLAENNGGNYDVIPAGKVSDTNGDPAELICERLFPLLVAPGEPEPPTEATESEDKARSELRREITQEFKSLGILASVRNDQLPNPIWADQEIQGQRTIHPVSYLQYGRETTVMEVVDFTTPRKAYPKDHAGWTAKMFDDVGNRQDKPRRTAIIRAGKDDLSDKVVKYALSMLEGSADEILDWADTAKRNRFLEARRDAAYAVAP
jgi:hypothetical protein